VSILQGITIIEVSEPRFLEEIGVLISASLSSLEASV
jgi:hypothetical protein